MAPRSEFVTGSRPLSPRKPLLARFAREVNVGDLSFRWATALAALLVLLLLGLVSVQLWISSRPTIDAFGFHFITSDSWDPVRDEYGALPFLYGTLMTSGIALLIAVPVSLGVAIFLTELCPPALKSPLSFLIELLAAVPSVIYGLWGVLVLVPWLRTTVEPALASTFGFIPFFQGQPRGNGMLAAALVLSIMILPTISSVSREVLRAVPSGLREGALALGATTTETLFSVTLPFARSGIVGAVILGLGRALGETMAVTMVIGNNPTISKSLFEPASTMASIIANQYGEAQGLQLAALTQVGLLLFGLTLLLNIIARLLVVRVGKRASFSTSAG